MRRCVGRMWLLALAACWAAGCGASDAEKGPSFQEKQDRAISDPMNYKVDFSDKKSKGRGIAEFDKEGFNRDVQRVLNP